MFALPGVIALLVFVYLRPQEVWPALAPVGPGLAIAACLFGLVVDVRRRQLRPLLSPLLVVTGLFFAWCLLDLLLKVPAGGSKLPVYLTALIVPVLLSQAVQGIRALRIVAGAVLAISVTLAALGTEQGLTPRTCLRLAEGATEDRVAGVFTGRLCQNPGDCVPEGERASAEYQCERQGLLGTTSVGGGRVRYRGILQDPNELAWAVSAGLPFALAFFLGAPGGRRRPARMALALLPLALGLACVVMTRSRTGQLAVLAALAAFFVRRPLLAALLGIGAAIPLAALGGRAGAEADASTQERIECWREGLSMFRDSPVLGVGPGQFTEHHYLTAHNSFVLCLAELGPIGLFLWTAVVYLCFKTALTVERYARSNLQASDLRPWAAALVGSWAATAVSAFFLSLSYHPVLWVFVGLSAALHAAVRRHDPGWRVHLGWRDAALIGGIDLAVMTGVYAVTRASG